MGRKTAEMICFEFSEQMGGLTGLESLAGGQTGDPWEADLRSNLLNPGLPGGVRASRPGGAPPIHDIGLTLAHKRQLVRMIVLEGRKIEDVCRATDHSPEAAHRYLKAFKQVLLCHQKCMAIAEISYAVRISQRLAREYLNLIDVLANDNRALEALLREIPLQ